MQQHDRYAAPDREVSELHAINVDPTDRDRWRPIEVLGRGGWGSEGLNEVRKRRDGGEAGKSGDSDGHRHVFLSAAAQDDQIDVYTFICRVNSRPSGVNGVPNGGERRDVIDWDLAGRRVIRLDGSAACGSGPDPRHPTPAVGAWSRRRDARPRRLGAKHVLESGDGSEGF